MFLFRGLCSYSVAVVAAVCVKFAHAYDTCSILHDFGPIALRKQRQERHRHYGTAWLRLQIELDIPLYAATMAPLEPKSFEPKTPCDIALEFASGADFWCKLMSGGCPVDLRGSRGRFVG